MVRDVLVDAGFVVALLSRRDNHHEWAATPNSLHLGPHAKLSYPSPSIFLEDVEQPISAHWFAAVLCWLASNLPKTSNPF